MCPSPAGILPQACQCLQVLEEARLWQHLHVSSALNHCLLSTALILLQPKFSGEHTASRVLCCMSCTQDRQAFQGSIGPQAAYRWLRAKHRSFTHTCTVARSTGLLNSWCHARATVFGSAELL